MAKKFILLVFLVSMAQYFQSQNSYILDAKFSPTSNIIALAIGNNDITDLKVYFLDKDKLSHRLIADSLNNTTVREFEFSPEGDKIALLLTSDMITDLFLYDIENQALTRCTNSNELKDYDPDFAYKNSLNWCDNQNIILLSKHSGLVQQYIFNVVNKTFEANGSSKGNEYFLTYSRKNKESYYIAGINNREPSVYRRKLGSSENIEISKDRNNHMGTLLSDNDNYLFYSIMPEISPCIYDLNNSKVIKTKLPKSNINIVGWSEKDTTIFYTFAHYEGDENFPIKDLFSYNYLSQKKQLISNEIETNFGVLCSSDATKIIYSKALKTKSTSPTHRKYDFEDIQTFIYDNKGLSSNLSGYGVAMDWSDDNKTVVFAKGNKLVLLNTVNGKEKSIEVEN